MREFDDAPTTPEVAQVLDVSWVTAEDYLFPAAAYGLISAERGVNHGKGQRDVRVWVWKHKMCLLCDGTGDVRMTHFYIMGDDLPLCRKCRRSKTTSFYALYGMSAKPLTKR